MQSELFERSNLEVEGRHFALQNSQLLRVALGPDVLSVKGAMVAFQGQVRFDHEGSGSVSKLLKKMVTSEDMPLMRVSGLGEVFFAQEAGYVTSSSWPATASVSTAATCSPSTPRCSGTSTGSRVPG
jgi:uncharacterized protein (AIM24 family)